jgi:RHS repeat-associated protein
VGASPYPDGHQRVQMYDYEGRLVSRCYQYTGGLESRCYTASYDPVGNPVQMTDPEGTDTLSYDALNRLVQVSRTNGDVEDYAYNTLGALSENAGVLLNMQWPRLDGSGMNDSAVPSSFNGLPVTRDAGGRITSLNGATLAFGKRNEIQSITDGATTETYDYDGFMRRILRANNQGVEEAYVYEDTTLDFGAHSIGPTASSLVTGNSRPPFDRTPQTLGTIDGLAPQNIVAVLDDSGGVTSSIFYDSVDHPLRLARSGLIYYYEVDLAGNVRRIRDINGNDLGGYRYTAFGELYAADADTPAPSLEQPLQWKGRWFNSLAGGIYDIRARQWSPGMGVFLQIDEFEEHDSNSTLWAWGNQNPARFLDPSGRQSGGVGLPPTPEPGSGDEPNQCLTPEQKEQCKQEDALCQALANSEYQRCENGHVPPPPGGGTCRTLWKQTYQNCMKANPQCPHNAPPPPGE